MAEREKVIKGLSELEGFLFSEYGKASADEANIWYDRFLAVSDALALLKEQEAVEPKKTAYQKVDHTIAYRYRCGTCDMSIFPSYKYCPFCGKTVKCD